MLALALKDVPIEPVAKQMWPTFVQMADEVALHLSAAIAGGELAVGRVGFPDWLAMWREQFCSWHDSVRLLVCQQARGGKAEFLIDHLRLVDGFAFADFLLTAVICHSEREAFRARLRGLPEPAPLLPGMVTRARQGRAPAMNAAVNYLYARFQHHAPFQTEPAPTVAVPWSDVSEIYRQETAADLADLDNHS